MMMIPEQATRFKCERFAVSSLDDHTTSRGQKVHGMRCKRPSYCDVLHSLPWRRARCLCSCYARCNELCTVSS